MSLTSFTHWAMPTGDGTGDQRAGGEKGSPATLGVPCTTLSGQLPLPSRASATMLRTPPVLPDFHIDTQCHNSVSLLQVFEQPTCFPSICHSSPLITPSSKLTPHSLAFCWEQCLRITITKVGRGTVYQGGVHFLYEG